MSPSAASNPIVVIPARLAATRLPNKPLADIHGEPMIVHVWRRSVAAGLGPVVVACGDKPIAEAIEAAGGTAVLTDPDLPSGSDRIAQALRSIDPDGRHDIVVNVQGDLPTLDPALPRAAMALLDDPAVDIGTLAAVIVREEEKTNPAIVKAIVEREEGARTGRAFYFTRTTAPSGEGPLLHHIGLYAYRRAALERYVTLPPSALERREKLEQLRALTAGMRIDVAIVDTVPLGVDTQEELERARRLLAEGAVR